MSAAAITVLWAGVSRFRGTVHLAVETAEGSGVLRFSLADAQRIGRELAAAAQAAPDDAMPARPPTLPHIVAASRGLPLTKPNGGL